MGSVRSSSLGPRKEGSSCPRYAEIAAPGLSGLALKQLTWEVIKKNRVWTFAVGEYLKARTWLCIWTLVLRKSPSFWDYLQLPKSPSQFFWYGHGYAMGNSRRKFPKLEWFSLLLAFLCSFGSLWSRLLPMCNWLGAETCNFMILHPLLHPLIGLDLNDNHRGEDWPHSQETKVAWIEL